MTTANKPRVYAKFIEKPIIAENGRLVFALVNAFASSGYPVALFESTDFRALGPPGRLIYSVEGVAMTTSAPENTENMIYLFDKEDSLCASRAWQKKIQVKFDVFSHYTWASYRGNEPIVMPYSMHPWNYGDNFDARLIRARSMEKKVRIFFSGDTKGYKTNRIFYPAPKLTRIQVIDTLLKREGDHVLVVRDKETLDAFLKWGLRQSMRHCRHEQGLCRRLAE